MSLPRYGTGTCKSRFHRTWSQSDDGSRCLEKRRYRCWEADLQGNTRNRINDHEGNKHRITGVKS